MKELFLTSITKPTEVTVEKFSFFVSVSFFLFPGIKGQAVKGQLISKQNCRAVTSPKKRMKHAQESILSAFRSRSYSSTILFRDLLTFRA